MTLRPGGSVVPSAAFTAYEFAADMSVEEARSRLCLDQPRRRSLRHIAVLAPGAAKLDHQIAVGLVVTDAANEAAFDPGAVDIIEIEAAALPHIDLFRQPGRGQQNEHGNGAYKTCGLHDGQLEFPILRLATMTAADGTPLGRPKRPRKDPQGFNGGQRREKYPLFINILVDMPLDATWIGTPLLTVPKHHPNR
jgi:hypothetical protein